MPVVQVYMYKGRLKEVKKELVRRITKDFQEVANIAPEALHILFTTWIRRIGEREEPSPRIFLPSDRHSVVLN